MGGTTVKDLPPERSGRPLPPDLVETRRMMAGAIEAGTWRTDPPARADTLNGVRVIRFQPPGPKRGVVLHFHGGGFRIGCPEMIGPYAVAIAARCDVEVICVAYRLAPEHPFPCGLNDAYAVLNALKKAGETRIILSGDSAGGGLATSLTSLAVADGAPPQGLVALSPWLDLTVTARAYDSNAATDPLFSAASAHTAADLYLQGLSPKHPLASPLFGPVAGFPPTFISVGEGEVLADDGRTFYEALRAANVSATFLPIAGMEHVAVTRNMALPGAKETFEAVVAFINGLK